MEETKKCPFCGEEILAVAKKCRYCGRRLTQSEEADKAHEALDSAKTKEELVEEYNARCSEMMDEIIKNITDKDERREQLYGLHEKYAELKQRYIDEGLLTEEDFELYERAENNRKIDWNALFKPFEFSGTLGRKNYWVGILQWVGVLVFFIIILAVLGVDAEEVLYVEDIDTFWDVVKLLVVVLYIPLCMISGAVRRLRDAGKSPWLWLLGLIPVVGQIILIVLLAQPSVYKR